MVWGGRPWATNLWAALVSFPLSCPSLPCPGLHCYLSVCLSVPRRPIALTTCMLFLPTAHVYGVGSWVCTWAALSQGLPVGPCHVNEMLKCWVSSSQMKCSPGFCLDLPGLVLYKQPGILLMDPWRQREEGRSGFVEPLWDVWNDPKGMLKSNQAWGPAWWKGDD